MRGRRDAAALNSLELSCSVLMSLSLGIFLFPQHTKYRLGSIATYFRIIPLSTLSPSRISKLYTVSTPQTSKVEDGDVNWNMMPDSGTYWHLPSARHVPASGLSPAGKEANQDKDAAPVGPPRWSRWCPGPQEGCQRPWMPPEASPVFACGRPLTPQSCSPNTSYPDLPMGIRLVFVFWT